MSEALKLKKPYEISVWGDRLVKISDSESYFEEIKLAVIGSDTMTALNRVSSPILTINTNGEKTLTFSLMYYYFDELVGDFVVNPFSHLLVNERKIKLKYNNKWYDFVIKERNENSETYEYQYTCTDAFIQELSKNGYNVTFNTDLNNNQGTITELAEATLKDTDWEVDKIHSDLLRQTVSDPIFNCTLTGSFEALNLDTNQIEIIQAEQINDRPEQFYIFYNYVINGIEENLQFIRETDIKSDSYDDNNALHLTNYRYLGRAIHNKEAKTITVDNGVFHIGEINLESQAYRLVYNIKTTYDPVTQHTVNLFQAELDHEVQEIYGYTVYDYSTSAAVVSYIANGNNFVLNELGTNKKNNKIVGWDNQCVCDDNTLSSMDFITRPVIDADTEIAKLEELNKVSGYLGLEYKPANPQNKYANAFYNDGIIKNANVIDHIAKGEEYVFRVRYGFADSFSDPIQFPQPRYNTTTLRAVVAKYNYVDKALGDKTTVKVREVDKNNIYFDFTDNFIQKDNVVRGGQLENDNSAYVIDGIIQNPSLKYAYRVDNPNGSHNMYVWNPDIQKYVSPSTYPFMPSYYTVAAAKQALSHETLSNLNEHIGLFLYDTTETGRCVFIEDVAFFKKVLDADGNIVLPGDAPVAKTTETNYFYLKPNQGALVDEIDQFSDLQSLASELNITKDKIKQLYNDNCEKVLSIEIEHSNYFNILQTLCETFQCWIRFEVEHEETGAIKLNTQHKPIKRVVFKEFIGKPNYAGFKYDINLNSIERTLDSSEFVTKLIVGSSASDYVEKKNLTIADATSNISGESFIFNFNYYLKTGLINRADFNADLNTLYTQIKTLNNSLSDLNTEYYMAQNSLGKIISQRNVLTATLEQANSNLIKELEHFKTVTGTDYDSYSKLSADTASNEKVNYDSIKNIVYNIYTYATIINSYNGLVSAIKTEFNDLNLICNGAETFSASVITSNGTQETSPSTKLIFNNYFEGFECNFIKDGEVVESFKTNFNSKIFNSDVAYDTIQIIQIPNNYNLEYYNNGRHIVCEKITTLPLQIYDTQNHLGITRRFKLVPKDEFLEAHHGLLHQIEKIKEQKQQILNDFNSKYSKFIQEGTWESTDYIDSELYYLDAVEVSNVSAQPKVTYTINVAEISEQEGYENYNFDVGDKTYIEDVQFFGATSIKVGERIIHTPIKEEVIVSAVEWHLDDPAENIITVQNYKTQFEDLFQRISATVQSVQYNSASYSRAASIFDENGNINADLLVSSLNGLAGSSFDLTSGGAVRATKEGLIVRDLTSSGNYIIITSGGIERTRDGGYTRETILSADGINIDALKAGTIDTTQISIMDGDNPSFRWDKYGLSAFGYSEGQEYDLNTFVRFDKYGLYGIKKGGTYVVESLDDLKDKAHFGITWDGFFIKNSYTNGYVSISSDNDFQVMRKIENPNITYVPTEDTEIIEGKEYYSLENHITYDEVKNPDETELSNYYEYDENNNEYILTTDTEIDAEKQYYTLYEYVSYELVDNPTIENLPSYYEALSETEIDYTEKIKIGALEFDDTGQPIRYGINIRNNDGAVVFTTDDNGDLTMTGTIHASAGHIGGMEVNASALTMDTIVLRPNTGIYSTNTILTGDQPIYEWQWQWTGPGEDDGEWIQVETGRTEPHYEPVFIISDIDGSAIFNNAKIRGEINAGSGNFYGTVTVGKDENQINKPYIIIDGERSLIKSSNYQDGANYGWMINKNGDAVFNNITARGAIKTAVFEYAEIQAVGGIFIFRPSSTIKAARIADNEQDLILKVEKSVLFATTQGRPFSWCKISNYTSDGSEPNVQDILRTNGLTHVYQIIGVDLNEGEVTLKNGINFINAVIQEDQTISDVLKALEGGALVDMGQQDYIRSEDIEVDNEKNYYVYNALVSKYIKIDNPSGNPHTNHYYEFNPNTSNYGIGVNSSDNTVNLPRRAITLFETVVDENADPKVSYNYKGILGTLPILNYDNNNAEVSVLYHHYMEGTQGIYTNNMYIGDAKKYLAFYHYKERNEQTGELEEKTNLRLVADEFIIASDDSDLIDLINNSVYETVIEYCLSTSTITNTHSTMWTTIMPFTTEDYPYLWQRTKTIYNDGSIKYIPDDGGIGDGFYVETASGGAGSPGEDALSLHINSSNGEYFRNNSDTSVLTVTIFKGATEITSQNQLNNIYGENKVVLRWLWKDYNADNYTTVPSALLSDNGFTFNIDGTMVSLSKIFQCELIYNEGD